MSASVPIDVFDRLTRLSLPTKGFSVPKEGFRNSFSLPKKTKSRQKDDKKSLEKLKSPDYRTCVFDNFSTLKKHQVG